MTGTVPSTQARHQRRACVLFKLEVAVFRRRIEALTLVEPLVIAVATYKDEGQRIRLSDGGLEKDGFAVSTIRAIGLFRTCERRIVGNSRRYRVQNVANFLLALVAIH